jgi:FixJ family two-component response regulator
MAERKIRSGLAKATQPGRWLNWVKRRAIATGVTAVWHYSLNGNVSGQASNHDAAASDHEAPVDQAARVQQLLAVGLEPSLTDRLSAWAGREPKVGLTTVNSYAAARDAVQEQGIDLVLTAATLDDGSGLALADELALKPELTQTVVVAAQPTVELATAAMRCGAADLIEPDLDWPTLHHRLQQVLTRPTRDRVQAQRAERLQALCQRLNSAREAVNDQVDTLCQDLVSAYQDLANQMDQAMHGTEYAAVLDNELDLETLIRRTLEFLVRKLGKAHGVVYLPCNSDEYSLAGFVSYDSADGPAEMLMDDLADRLVPAVGRQDQPVKLTNHQDIAEWTGDEKGPLQGQHILAFPCRDDDETLAVVCLFRDEAEPFDGQAKDIAGAVAPKLGDALGRMIRIHYRHMPDPDDSSAADAA